MYFNLKSMQSKQQSLNWRRINVGKRNFIVNDSKSALDDLSSWELISTPIKDCLEVLS